MPHQCTECDRVFEDGSKEMLSGCPGCGGNTFQYHSEAADVPAGGDAAAPPERPGGGSVAGRVGQAATTVRDLVGPSPDAGEGPAADVDAGDAPGGPEDAGAPSTAAGAEDAAQASARSELVSPEDLPAASGEPRRSHPTPVLDERTDPPADEGGEDRPDLADLRAELNEQFESIKVVEPGEYELNLMSLYNREEYIIALREDGKYTIQVPERWGNND